MHVPVAARTVLRALVHRPATTMAMLVVAVVASATAAAGPAYYASAKSSILHDTFVTAPLTSRGVELSRQGDISKSLNSLVHLFDSTIARAIPNPTTRTRLLSPPIQAVEGTANMPALNEHPTIAWRSDFCANLQIATGRCATSANEVIVSTSLARRNGWRVGQQVAATEWPRFTIVGIYRIPEFSLPYWFGRGTVYFPLEDGVVNAHARESDEPADGLFTPLATINGNLNFPQGSVVVDDVINEPRLRGSDLPTVRAMTDALSNSPDVVTQEAAVQTGLPTVVQQVQNSWHSLSVPIFLVSAELLLLVWLLMLLMVTDAVEARGPHVALMKLRGLRGARLLWFGLGEPISLLAVALPVGALLGWAISAALASNSLRTGTPVGLPALSWGAASAATVGGLAAVLAAGRRTLRRSIVDQWQRTNRSATRRSWVLDAIVVTAAGAGLVELTTSGQVTTIASGSLGLLVPGLLGLAAAVIAARLLPFACRALYATTRKRGGLGLFLAIRHIARRPNAMRAAVVLATAFALASFGLASWSTGRANRTLLADVDVGAPTVFTVAAPSSTRLAAIVDRIDPSGRAAVAVDRSYDVTGSGQVLIAADPTRFFHVATWRNRFAPESPAKLAQQLTPPAAPPIVINGDALRVRLDVQTLSQLPQVVIADVASSRGLPAQSIELGTIDTSNGPVTLTQPVSNCPCSLVDLTISNPTQDFFHNEIHGTARITEIDVHAALGWRALTGLGSRKQFRTSGPLDKQTVTPGGLLWSFAYPATSSATLTVADRPDPVPAIVTRSVGGTNKSTTVEVAGLNQQSLAVHPIAQAVAVPGSITGGVIVDQTYAERAASAALASTVQQQVWTTASASRQIADRLQRAGVRIVQTQVAAREAHQFNRQGPGLASIAFLVDALAATVLAAAGTILSLVIAARRRRYEYAALLAAGARPRSIYLGLVIEQATVLVFGAAVGIAAGIGAAVLALRSVPEFVTTPPAGLLSYSPDVTVLVPALGIALAALLAVAAASSWLLTSRVDLALLREGPS